MTPTLPLDRPQSRCNSKRSGLSSTGCTSSDGTTRPERLTLGHDQISSTIFGLGLNVRDGLVPEQETGRERYTISDTTCRLSYYR